MEEMPAGFWCGGGRPEGKRQLGRRTRRWGNNMVMDLQEIEWEVLDCINLILDGDKWWTRVNRVRNLQVP